MVEFKEETMKQREHVSFDKPRRSQAYKRTACAMFFGATIAIVPLRSWADSDDPKRFIPDTLVSSTVPSNGDLNPYGIVFVHNCRRFVSRVLLMVIQLGTEGHLQENQMLSHPIWLVARP
jgi:hypothetical protein